VALAAAASSLVVSAGTAQAAVPGIQRVLFFGPPPTTLDPTHLLTGVCPAGKQVHEHRRHRASVRSSSRCCA
jgi:hypothetical protein